jgi:hypothetical protein
MGNLLKQVGIVGDACRCTSLEKNRSKKQRLRLLHSFVVREEPQQKAAATITRFSALQRTSVL